MPLASVTAALTCLVLTLGRRLSLCCRGARAAARLQPMSRSLSSPSPAREMTLQLCSGTPPGVQSIDELTQTFERIVYSISHFWPPLPQHILWGKEKHGLVSTP